jgi:hypothetical protein
MSSIDVHGSADDGAAHRRRNADQVNDGTTWGRVYSRLLHLQLDFQEAGDEAAEELLCDAVLDPFYYKHKPDPSPS